MIFHLISAKTNAISSHEPLATSLMSAEHYFKKNWPFYSIYVGLSSATASQKPDSTIQVHSSWIVEHTSNNWDFDSSRQLFSLQYSIRMEHKNPTHNLLELLRCSPYWKQHGSQSFLLGAQTSECCVFPHCY
jgi:hypothetical protein